MDGTPAGQLELDQLARDLANADAQAASDLAKAKGGISEGLAALVDAPNKFGWKLASAAGAARRAGLGKPFPQHFLEGR